jgi:hypothetical protein
MPLLSFSIDLSHSTEVKSIINEIVGNNKERKEQYLRKFHRLFTDIERRLYAHFIHHDIPFEPLFLVKSIGDELWYLYDLNNRDKTANLHAINQLFSFLIELNGSSAHDFLISEQDVDVKTEGKKDPKIWDAVKHQEIMLRIKSYADLIEDYINPAQERFETVRNAILNAMGEKLRTQGLSQQQIESSVLSQFPSIAERLNLGYTEIQDSRDSRIMSKYIRTDVIGKDVDLFFRCSKYATTCLLTIGDKLFQYAASDISEDEMKIRGDQHERYYYFKKTLPQSKLKGIDHDYSIYVLPPSDPVFARGCHKDLARDGCAEARRLLLKTGYLRRRLLTNAVNKLFAWPLSYPPRHRKKQ